MCAYYDINGQFRGSYEYKRRLVDYSIEGNIAAMIFVNEERRTSELVTLNAAEGTVYETPLDYEVLNVQVSGDMIYMLSANKVESRTSMGEPVSSAALDTDYDDFCRMGGYIYLLGYDTINRIDFN